MARGPFFTEAEKREIWDRWSEPLSGRLIAHKIRRSKTGVQTVLGSAGGVRPRSRCRSPRHRSHVEREEISRGIEADETFRGIAARLGRAPSTVSREVEANGGRPHSPWQRGTNENTNGLLRQYFPKGTPLSGSTEIRGASLRLRR